MLCQTPNPFVTGVAELYERPRPRLPTMFYCGLRNIRSINFG